MSNNKGWSDIGACNTGSYAKMTSNEQKSVAKKDNATSSNSNSNSKEKKNY